MRDFRSALLPLHGFQMLPRPRVRHDNSLSICAPHLLADFSLKRIQNGSAHNADMNAQITNRLQFPRSKCRCAKITNTRVLNLEVCLFACVNRDCCRFLEFKIATRVENVMRCYLVLYCQEVTYKFYLP